MVLQAAALRIDLSFENAALMKPGAAVDRMQVAGFRITVRA